MTRVRLVHHLDVRVAAEDLAAEAVADAFEADLCPEWRDLDDETRGFMTDGAAHRLCDLSRKSSTDWWARWLAERLGLTVGATAPEWVRVYVGRPDMLAWRLGPQSRTSPLFTSTSPDSPPVFQIVPGISALTNPAEALALAIEHVAKVTP